MNFPLNFARPVMQYQVKWVMSTEEEEEKSIAKEEIDENAQNNSKTTSRLSWARASHGALVAMRVLSNVTANSGLETSLLNLIDIRVSQVNGCAECIDLHSKNARLAGETERRIYGLSAWRDSPFYTAKERAALAWAEAVTLVAETHVPDDVYEEARKYFSEREIVNLTLAVIAINAWNRMNISFRIMPDSYVPREVRVIRGKDSLS